MNTTRAILFGLVIFKTSLLNAQTSLVGSGSSYANIFSPSDSITYDVPGGGLINITLSNGSSTKSSGVWDLTAQGGANASILLSLTESAAQVALTGSSLQFNISNNSSSLLGLLGTGVSVHYGWEAQAFFDTGPTLSYTPFTTYNVSFNVAGNNGLLGSVTGVTPQFQFELIDGLGNALTSNGSGTLIDIAGLLGSGVTSGAVNLSYTVAGTAPSGPVGVRFTGDALVGSTAVGIGTNFATISNLNISATPVPEPGSCMLVASTGMLFLLRRSRRRTLTA